MTGTGEMMERIGLVQELTFVREIAALIDRYKSKNGTIARPDDLRDDMLQVAGLLHLEAAGGNNADHDFYLLRESFMQRADKCLAEVRRASSCAKDLQN